MRHATAVDKIPGSIREARAILRGESKGELVVHVPPEFDVKALRRKLGTEMRSNLTHFDD